MNPATISIILEAIREVVTIIRRKQELSQEESDKLDTLIQALQNESTKPPHWQIEP